MSAEDQERQAFELVRVQGRSYSEAGKALGGIPKSTIRTWVTREATRRARAQAEAAAPKTIANAPAWVEAMRASRPPPADASDAEDDADALLGPERAPCKTGAGADEMPELAPLPENADIGTILRHQIKEMQSFIQQARRLGNLETAQRFSRSMVELAQALRQHEKSARQDDGVIVFKKADVDAALEEIAEKVRAVEDEPLVCARCAPEMRRAKAGG